MAREAHIKGTIERITYQNHDNGWLVSRILLDDGQKRVTVTGPLSQAHEGHRYEFFGEWINHPQYGWQLNFNRAVAIEPTNESEIISYLASGLFSGVGPKTAQKIVRHFKKDTLTILKKHPEKLKEVKGLGKATLDKILTSWRAAREDHELQLFCNTHHIALSYIPRIKKAWGQSAIDIIARNPYELAMHIHGIGFKKADQIAKSLGIEKDAPERIRAGIIYLLQLAEDEGHCYLTEEQLLSSLESNLDLSADALEASVVDCLSQLNKSFQIKSVYEPDHIKHYRYRTYVHEQELAQNLQQRLQQQEKIDQHRLNAWLNDFCRERHLQLSEDQKKAVEEAIKNKIFILTGGPGVGKTTTAQAIIHYIRSMGKSIALCAPTGRAAQRLKEVTGVDARTIHRLLKWNPFEAQFDYNSENPLPVQAVVVDEASMLDIHLAHALITATLPKTQIIMIGDTDQLPSVGPGHVLRDLISSKKIPATCLSEVFRQAQQSQIVCQAHKINRGEIPEFDQQSDCKFITTQNNEQIITYIKQLLVNKLPQAGYDPIEDVQILTPMNRGPLGADTLNKHIQRLLNPDAREYYEHQERLNKEDIGERFFPGDKVIHVVNNYDLNIFNGDIGIVRHADPRNKNYAVYYSNQGLVEYSKEQARELKLAYAITIHKSQGSEFPVAIIPVSLQHYVMLQRNLIYTGLTRARSLAVFIGDPRALKKAITTVKANIRQTRLEALLSGS